MTIFIDKDMIVQGHDRNDPSDCEDREGLQKIQYDGILPVCNEYEVLVAVPNPDYGKKMPVRMEEETIFEVDNRRLLLVRRPQPLTPEEVAEKERQEQRAQIVALYDHDTELKILREEIAALRAGKPQTAAFAEMDERIRGITGGDDSTTTETKR